MHPFILTFLSTASPSLHRCRYLELAHYFATCERIPQGKLFSKNSSFYFPTSSTHLSLGLSLVTQEYSGLWGNPACLLQTGEFPDTSASKKSYFDTRSTHSGQASLVNKTGHFELKTSAFCPVPRDTHSPQVKNPFTFLCSSAKIFWIYDT